MPNTQNFFKIYLYDHEIGYEIYKIDYSDITVRTSVKSIIIFNRGNTHIRIEKESIITETTNGKPIWFEFCSVEKGNRLKVIGTVAGNFLVIKEIKGHEINDLNIPTKENFLFDQGIIYFIRSCLISNKKNFIYSYYSPEFKKIISVENYIKDVKGDIITIESKHDLTPQVSIIEKRNKSGELIEQYIPNLHIKKRLINNNERFDHIDKELNIQRLGLIEAINCPKVSFERIAKISYKIHFSGKINIKEDIRQKVIKTDKDNIFLEVSRDAMVMNKNGSDLNTDLSEYLKNNEYLNIDNLIVREIISELKTASKDINDLVYKIHHWVYNNIRYKDLEMQFGNVNEILNTKHGDCSEHAILSMALFRAAKIPSKLSYGVVFDNDFFWNHLWIELFFDKKWIPLDPTKINSYIDTKYIKFGDISLNSISKAELGLIMSNNLNIKSIEITSFVEDSGR